MNNKQGWLITKDSYCFLQLPKDTPLFSFQSYSGLRLQELQEAKDLVVVETADMLRVPLFTAEALLRNNGKGDLKNFLRITSLHLST